VAHCHPVGIGVGLRGGLGLVVVGPGPGLVRVALGLVVVGLGLVMVGLRLGLVPVGAGLGRWVRLGLGLGLWHRNCPFALQVGDGNCSAVVEPRPTVHPASVAVTVTSSAVTKIRGLIAKSLPGSRSLPGHASVTPGEPARLEILGFPRL
jgi:hypothetical protein